MSLTPGYILTDEYGDVRASVYTLRTMTAAVCRIRPAATRRTRFDGGES